MHISYALTALLLFVSAIKLLQHCTAYFSLMTHPILFGLFSLFMLTAFTVVIKDEYERHKEQRSFNVTARLILHALEQVRKDGEEQKTKEGSKTFPSQIVTFIKQHGVHLLKLFILFISAILVYWFKNPFFVRYLKFTPYTAILFNETQSTFYIIVAVSQTILTYFLLTPYLPMITGLLISYIPYAYVITQALFYSLCSLRLLTLLFEQPDIVKLKAIIKPFANVEDDDHSPIDSRMQGAIEVIAVAKTEEQLNALCNPT